MYRRIIFQNEFPIASKYRSKPNHEFIFDYNDIEKNPLLNTSGIKKILQVQKYDR